MCALVVSSSDDDSEEDSSDEDAVSVKKRPSKSKRKSRSHKNEKKRSNRHKEYEEESSLGSIKLATRKRFGPSRWEDLNLLEVVHGLHVTTIRADRITNLREGRSKTNAATAGAKEDTKTGKEIQTSMDIKAVMGAIGFGEQHLVLVPVLPATTGRR